ncbi:putative thioredoxin [Georgenia satyanarayanai]|uniref:Putative thioredoxin n=1 Tax=Georgenia satyanarayanai TaxID=860221 RepID=A0A2Y9AC33_9MICO|nr:tetratricopeptide repeat protein [Georgenia satyanarayanai]PYG00488.1 putative thioredoxin [Georgenia satyanarayanai]SSA39877.1 putative thioredoxin [Georgenia satyanarayanai]
MSQPSINLHGAVDLSALARPPQSPSAPAGDATEAPVVVDVTEATFQQTVELSMRVPVVVEVSAAYAGGPSAVLDKVVTDLGGRVQLARVDVETSPQIAQAFQVQAVPTVVAIVRGQPVPLYQGDYPEEQLRAVIDELLRVAAQAGVTGTVSGSGAEEEPAAPEEPPLPPLHAEALDAIEREDYPAAADAYRRALKENPADHEASAALAQVELIIRTASSGGLQAITDAEGVAPTDVAAHLAAADAEIAAGRPQAAFDRLIAVVRATAGEDREEARKRIVEYFEIVGNADPAVADARRNLASALY